MKCRILFSGEKKKKKKKKKSIFHTRLYNFIDIINGFSPGMCIDIVEIWFGIANGQISSIFH